MTESQKKKQLRQHKWLATGLLLLMATIFAVCLYLQKKTAAPWAGLGYIRAFTEAAMVGALADWFAVTALFHHPLGLKIPHTNLIQSKKEQIGGNLGKFVEENFLSAANVRPYIAQIDAVQFLLRWVEKPENRILAIQQVKNYAAQFLRKSDDTQISHLIVERAQEFIAAKNLHLLAGQALEYLVRRGEHEKLLTTIGREISQYVQEHPEVVRERVKKESFALIPSFVDDAIAEKISKGLSTYFAELAEDEHHPIRLEVGNILYSFSRDVKEGKRMHTELDELKNNLSHTDQLLPYATDLWQNIKSTLLQELEQPQSALHRYLTSALDRAVNRLQTDDNLQNKINGFVRYHLFKTIARNTHRVSTLISTTVGKWEGRELSNKLELEVGKDLQFIRINGTLVGGLVGLCIYTIAQLITGNS